MDGTQKERGWDPDCEAKRMGPAQRDPMGPGWDPHHARGATVYSGPSLDA